MALSLCLSLCHLPALYSYLASPFSSQYNASIPCFANLNPPMDATTEHAHHATATVFAPISRLWALPSFSKAPIVLASH